MGFQSCGENVHSQFFPVLQDFGTQLASGVGLRSVGHLGVEQLEGILRIDRRGLGIGIGRRCGLALGLGSRSGLLAQACPQ